jgi:Ni/Fe-hydrogenase subunit HybB-like protein
MLVLGNTFPPPVPKRARPEILRVWKSVPHPPCFAQARGLEFWQSPLLFWHLLVQAIITGAAVITFMDSFQLVTPFQFVTPQLFAWLGIVLVVSPFVGLAMIFGELIMNHRSEEVVRSANLLIKGALWKQFWILVLVLGVIASIVLILWPTLSVTPTMAASVLVLVGLWMYKNLWIKAGQAVPLR